MKRISIGALVVAAALTSFTSGTEFEPLSVRAAARQLGIGFGQGYHSRPDLPNLRGHWNMVNRRQRWPIAPPAPYPATPFAPTLVGRFSGGEPSIQYSQSLHNQCNESMNGTWASPAPMMQYDSRSLTTPPTQGAWSAPAPFMQNDADSMVTPPVQESMGALMEGSSRGHTVDSVEKHDDNVGGESFEKDLPEEEMPSPNPKDEVYVPSRSNQYADRSNDTSLDSSVTEPSRDIIDDLHDFLDSKPSNQLTAPKSSQTIPAVEPGQKDVGAMTPDAFHFDREDSIAGDVGPVTAPEASTSDSLAATLDTKSQINPYVETPRTASLGPKSVAPKSVAPKSVAPKSVAPKSIAPDDQVRPNAAPRIIIHEQPENPLRRPPAVKPFGNSRVWW